MTNVRKYSGVIAVFLGSLALFVFFFQNCSQKNATEKKQEDFPVANITGAQTNDCKVINKVSRQDSKSVNDAFDRYNKLQFSKRFLQSKAAQFSQNPTLSKVSKASTIIPKNSILAVMYNEQCLLQRPSEILSAKDQSFVEEFIREPLITENAKVGLSRRISRLHLTQDIELVDLERIASDLECLFGISNNEPYLTSSFSAPNDGMFNDQKHQGFLKTTTMWDKFYLNSSSSSEKIIVAVVDTGVDGDHPDLASNMWRDTNGKFGYDFVNGDNDPMDDNGHGTHIAGLIGAKLDNELAGAGIFPEHVPSCLLKWLTLKGIPILPEQQLESIML